MFLLGGLAPKASGQELAKLVASDAAEEDYFGRSVAVSGDLVVVGANQNDAAGIDSGSVYVFRTTNGGASWTQVAKLVASDAAADDEFGGSVAVSGDLTAKLLASDAAAGDRFGYSVAISGDLVVVGAFYDDDAGSNSGSAYVFRTTNDGASWTQVAKLVASDAAATDYFGYSVAVSGDLVVAGRTGTTTPLQIGLGLRLPHDERRRLLDAGRQARRERRRGERLLRPVRRRQRRPRRRRGVRNGDAGIGSGSAYAFRTTNDGASWTQVAKLVANDAAAYDYFGDSVAVSGDLVVVRAWGNADAGDWSGSAYVFRTTNDGASWTETAKLVACDAAAADSFGESVAISGDLVVLGARLNDDAGSGSGSAYVFRTTNGAVTPTCGSSTASAVNMIVVVAAVVAAVVAVAIVCVCIKRRRTKAAAARADFNVEAPPDRDDAFAGDGLETRSVKELKAEAQIQASTGASNVAGAARHSASTKTPSAPPASASFAAAPPAEPVPSARYQQLMLESEGVVAQGMNASTPSSHWGSLKLDYKLAVDADILQRTYQMEQSITMLVAKRCSETREDPARPPRSSLTPVAIAEVVENAHVPEDELLIEMRELSGEVSKGLAKIIDSHHEMQQGHATILEKLETLTKWDRARRLKATHMEDNEIELDFVEVEPFAGGGQGSVHKAEYAGEIVCLKKFSLVGVGAQSARDRIVSNFKKEVGIMDKLRKHPRTVDFVGICTTDASFVGIVTQYLPNGSLRGVLDDARGDAIAPKMQFIWAKDIAIGMAYLHKEGVLHRDLKSQNVLLTNEWRCKITDFGISLGKLGRDSDMSEKIRDSAMMRTLIYIKHKI
ncbi:hypothetical protein JL720_8020 [Aureococcus anophagefferens]|nr:hypothetical protein JL720_8020 [Aureococcus anophagefferens]